MEDLYDNLDNYNDLNNLQELKNENQDLKQQLEEKTIAIGKLQNEYDKVNMEFKRLQINYSSLLKTARAEVERKTQMIANLNIEKDMIVLNALQAGNNIRRKFKSGTNNYNNKNDGSGIVKKEDSRIFVEKQKAGCVGERKKQSSMQSKETHDASIHLAHSDRLISELDPHLDIKRNINASESKENHTHQEEKRAEEIPKFRASSIKNRRKSMPAVSIREKFSDDELEQKVTNKETIKKESVPAHVKKHERRLLDTIDNHRSNTKTPESSSQDDKTSYNEPLRESHRSRHTRYYDNDKYRSRNKQDSSQRYRKYSPDRCYRKTTRTHQDDFHHRSHDGRHRVLESPPPAPYETRSRQNRYNRGADDYERKKSRLDEKHAYKHKIPNDDEPYSKRKKIESIKNNDDLFPANERRCGDREPLESISPFTPYELELEHESCQSPDYAQIEASLAHPVKEIMDIAAIPLEDPRVTSKKYSIKTDADGKTTLCIVSGRKVDILPINKSNWDIEHVDAPRALMNHPSKFSDDLVHDIYNDIDNPITNISMESGEIYDHDDVLKENLDTGKHMGNQNCAINKCTTENSEQLSNHVSNTKTVFDQYRIPKIKHEIDNTRNRNERTLLDTNYAKKNEESNSDNRTCKKSPTRLIDKHDELALSTRNGSSEGNKECHNHTAISARAIVEGDLELSDELSGSSDNVEVGKYNVFQTSEQSSVSLIGTEVQINNKTEGIHPSGTSIEHNLRENSRTSLIVSVKINRDEKVVCQNFSDTYQKSFTNNSLSVVGTEVKKHVEKKIIDMNHGVTDENIINRKSSCDSAIEPKVSVNTEQENEEITVQGDSDSKLRKMSSNDDSEINPEEKTKEPDIKKLKVKKKKSKAKQPLNIKESVEDIVDSQLSGNTIKSKKESKPKEIKEKFSDLFGDSSSLIMPEDLGIATYVPIFEDAQDAVDLNIKQIAPNTTSNVGIEMKKDAKDIDTNRIDYNMDQSKINNKIPSEVQINLVPIDTSSKSCSYSEEHIPSELDTKVYENLNTQMTVNKTAVVQTLIISTGLQPQSSETSAQSIPVVPDATIKTNQDLAVARMLEIKKEYLKALATSTPYKELSAPKVIEPETDTKAVENEVVVRPTDDQKSSIDSQNNPDVPDVRIIVRRRRKVVKKPPVT